MLCACLIAASILQAGANAYEPQHAIGDYWFCPRAKADSACQLGSILDVPFSVFVIQLYVGPVAAGGARSPGEMSSKAAAELAGKLIASFDTSEVIQVLSANEVTSKAEPTDRLATGLAYLFVARRADQSGRTVLSQRCQTAASNLLRQVGAQSPQSGGSNDRRAMALLALAFDLADARSKIATAEEAYKLKPFHLVSLEPMLLWWRGRWQAEAGNEAGALETYRRIRDEYQAFKHWDLYKSSIRHLKSRSSKRGRSGELARSVAASTLPALHHMRTARDPDPDHEQTLAQIEALERRIGE